MTLVPNTSITIDFLQRWKPGGPWALCAFHEDKRNDFATFDDTKLKELETWLKRQHAEEFNGYFHVNSVRPNSGKAKKGDVLRMEWLHVDLDPIKGRPLAEEQERIRTELQTTELLPPATVITFSGGGYQAFWKLNPSIELGGEIAKVEEVERFNVQIAKLLAADNCFNADRIMRLPGTINWPNKTKRDNGQTPVMAEVVLANWDAAYDPNNPEHFMKAPDLATGTRVGSKNQIQVNVSGNCQRVPAEAFGDEQGIFAKVSSRARVAIVVGKDPDQPLTGGNSRSDWLWHVACELVRKDFDDDTIYSIITDRDLGISEHVLAQGNPANVHRCALRTIQRAREAAIEPWLDQLNNEYALIESVGGKMRIACERYSEAKERYEIEFHQKDGFVTMHCNQMVIETGPNDKAGNPTVKLTPVGKWWLRHPNRRTYRDVVFYPNRDFPDSMNLWRGFAVSAVPGDCSLFLDHIKTVLCKGNEEYYTYMVQWMANAVQNPQRPGQVAIVLRGGQGTGKGTFAKMLGKLFGVHYKYVSNPKHVTGQFNAMLSDAVLVFADECFAANDKAAESALKSLITEQTIRTEQKGIDNMEARNCVHLIMATNHEWAISADLDDRRFFVVEIDDKYQMDIDYFSALHAQMDGGGYEALMHFLMTYDLAGFDVFKCPKTGELRKQQDQSMDEMPAFLLYALEEGRLCPTHSGWRTHVLKEELVDRFKAMNPRYWKDPNRALGIFLAKFNVRSEANSKPETWTDSRGQKRQSSSRPKIWAFPSLEECRTLWEAVMKGARTWPSVGEDNLDDGGPPDDGGDAF